MFVLHLVRPYLQQLFLKVRDSNQLTKEQTKTVSVKDFHKSPVDIKIVSFSIKEFELMKYQRCQGTAANNNIKMLFAQ